MPERPSVELEVDPRKQIKQFLGLLREGWFGILCWTLAGLLVGIALFQFLPAQYVSETRVMVRPTWVFDNERDAREERAIGQRSQLLEHELTSSSWIEAVLDDLEWPEWARARRDETRKKTFLDGVKQDTSVYIRPGEAGEAVVYVEYQNMDRWKARDFVASLRDHWIREVVGTYQDALQKKVSLGEEELGTHRRKLAEMETELLNFEGRREVAQIYRLPELNQQASQLRLDLDQAEQRLTELTAQQSRLQQLQQEMPEKVPVEQALTGAGASRQLTEVERLTLELDRLTAHGFTGEHPRVQALQDELALALQRASEAAAAGVVEAGMVDNPQRQALAQQLMALEVERDGTRALRDKVAKDLTRIEATLERIPPLQRELERRQVDYTGQLWRIQSVLDELEPLRNKLQALGMADNQRYLPYVILENPVPASSPEATAGLVALLASTLIGLGVAVVAIAGRSLLRSSFHSPEEAERVLRIPVLGQVGPIQTEGEARRARVTRGLRMAASLVLLAALAATIYLCSAHPELLPAWLVERAAEFRAGLS